MQPLSFGQQLHRFETAFEYYGNLFFGVHHYAFEQLADDLVIVFHRTVLYAVEYHIGVYPFIYEQFHRKKKLLLLILLAI